MPATRPILATSGRRGPDGWVAIAGTGAEAGSGPPDVRVRLLGGFELRYGGEQVCLAPAAERLVAFLALRRLPLSRAYVAGVLWSEVTDQRALGNLRSALWRLGHPGILRTVQERLSLDPCVGVDAHDLVAAAHHVCEPPDSAEHDLVDALACLLAGDLLPDWYEDWVADERERLRGLRLHALELLASRFLARREYALAHEAAFAAAQADPFRESALRMLLKVHLAQGNWVNARRQFEAYARLLRDELGIEPSFAIDELEADPGLDRPLAAALPRG
jgi:DNA-binding SARP family transcriptional activator